MPAELTSADYPNLIPQGQTMRDDFGAGPARRLQLEQGHAERYRRCVRFVEYLFDRFDKLRDPPYQPGWKQINLAGTVPGWTRFPPAQELLDKIAAKRRVDPAWPGRRLPCGPQQRGRAGAPVPPIP